MNLRDPEISRGLAKLIDYVDPDYHNQFIQDAAKSKDIKEFLQNFQTYSKIKLNK